MDTRYLLFLSCNILFYLFLALFAGKINLLYLITLHLDSLNEYGTKRDFITKKNSDNPAGYRIKTNQNSILPLDESASDRNSGPATNKFQN